MDSARSRFLAALQHARSSIDTGRVSMALGSGDSRLAISAVDRQALLGALLRRFAATKAEALADETIRAWGVLLASLNRSGAAALLSPDEVVQLFGLNLAQVPLITQTAASAVQRSLPAARAKRLISNRGEELLSARANVMAPELGLPDQSSIGDVAQAFQDEILAAYKGVVDSARAAFPVGQVREALESQNLAAVMALLPVGPFASGFASIGLALGAVLAAGGAAAIAALGRSAPALTGEEVDLLTQPWAREQARVLEDWARQSMEHLASAALRQEVQDLGVSGEQAAEAMRDRIGLGPKFIDAAVAARAEALAAGEPAAEAAAKTAAYAKETIAARAENFASDQTYGAATQGQTLGWQRAQADGLLSPHVARYSLSQRDRAVCPRCRRQDGEKRGLNEPFSEGEPGNIHGGCRCYQIVVGVTAV